MWNNETAVGVRARAELAGETHCENFFQQSCKFACSKIK
jgi:hypothetical protein